MDECKTLVCGCESGAVLDAATVRGRLGGAVQLDPMKPTLKPPGTKRLKHKYDDSPSSFAFKVKLRRYTSDAPQWNQRLRYPVFEPATRVTIALFEAGAHSCPLFSST